MDIRVIFTRRERLITAKVLYTHPTFIISQSDFEKDYYKVFKSSNNFLIISYNNVRFYEKVSYSIYTGKFYLHGIQKAQNIYSKVFTTEAIAEQWLINCKLALKEWSENKDKWQFCMCGSLP